MRITQRERFLKRVQSDIITRFFHRCVQCSDDVKAEPMHRFRDSDMNGRWWIYLCWKCAPQLADALNYWQKYEKES